MHNSAAKSGGMRPWLALMRLHQRTGAWLLLWPCWWAVALALPADAAAWRAAMPLFALFLTGAVVMRAAGCVINDMWDRDIDARVARTRTRPLASGALGMRQAMLLLGLLLLAGLAILLFFNALTIWLGLGFMALVVLYPLAKRVFALPQLVLALVFNAGALMGFAAVLGYLPPAAWLLYAACGAWIFGYDTIYAHQDKTDDAMLGLGSAALVLGQHTKLVLSASFLIMGVLLVAIGVVQQRAVVYYAAPVGVSAFLFWQLARLRLDAPAACMHAFRQHGSIVGWLVLLPILLDTGMRI